MFEKKNVSAKPIKEQLLQTTHQSLCACETCSYNIAKLFVPILKDLISNKYTVHNLLSFCIKKDPNHCKASFDIESLFTNIPLEETINISENNAFSRKKKVNGLLRKDFQQLLSMSVKSQCFVFNNVYSQQVYEAAMQSFIGVYLSKSILILLFEIVLDNLHGNIIGVTWMIFLYYSKKIITLKSFCATSVLIIPISISLVKTKKTKKFYFSIFS